MQKNISETEFKEFEPRRWTANTGSNWVPAQISKRTLIKISRWSNHVWTASRILDADQIIQILDLVQSPDLQVPKLEYSYNKFVLSLARNLFYVCSTFFFKKHI